MQSSSNSVNSNLSKTLTPRKFHFGFKYIGKCVFKSSSEELQCYICEISES